MRAIFITTALENGAQLEDPAPPRSMIGAATIPRRFLFGLLAASL
jgi:hypothetical protein